MNEPNSATGRLSLRELAVRAEQQKTLGNERAEVVIEAACLTPENVSLLKEDARVHEDTRDALKELEEAQKDVVTDPYARRAWLRALIEGLPQDDPLDLNKVLALLFTAMNNRLANGSDALPLFVSRSPREAASWKKRIFLPKSGRRSDGVLYSTGSQMVVPTTREDEAALMALRSIRKKAARTLTEMIERDPLLNLREVLWSALHFFDDASICRKAYVEENFQNGEANLLKRKSNSRLYSYFVLSDNEFFVVGQTDLSDRFVALMDENAQYQVDFWAGRINIRELISETISANAEIVISTDDFLANKPGIVAVRVRSWKDRPESNLYIKIDLLLERRETDLYWRWTLCNHKGVRSLFGGKLMRFHAWSNEELPPQVVAVLKKGTPIVD